MSPQPSKEAILPLPLFLICSSTNLNCFKQVFGQLHRTDILVSFLRHSFVPKASFLKLRVLITSNRDHLEFSHALQKGMRRWSLFA